MNVQLTDIADKKVAIFESTLVLVERHGFHGTSMSMIAREAGVATGTIYHYFKSKDELIIELLGYAKRIANRASFESDDTSEPYYDRFRKVWFNLYYHFVNHPQIMSFFNQYYGSPYSEMAEQKDTVCFQQEFRGFIEQGIQMQLVKPIDPPIISSLFLGSVINCAKQEIKGRYRHSQEDLETMVGIIWSGIKI